MRSTIKMPEKIVDVKGGGANVTLEQVRTQFTEYERLIRDYLTGLDANVEKYKFSVEKNGEAFTFDVEIRATVGPKHKTEIRK
jgi:hypothetical protein